MRLATAALAALTALLLSSCSTAPSTHAQATPKPSSPSWSQTPIASPILLPDPTTAPDPTHVFVVVLENRSYSQVVGTPYISQLASRYGMATNYHGVSHPSLPNYLAMTSGTTWGIVDDGFHSLPPTGLGAQLTAAGIDWRAYMEGMTNGCFRSPYPYTLKHNPFAYYGSACPPQVVPFTQFGSDMSGGNVPRFAWITPDLCHDGHDCSNAVVDRWLSQTIPTILASDAWQDNGVLLITWDEGEDSANSVLTLVIRANPLNHQSSTPYDHYSLLATIEDQLGLPRLGQAAQARPMNDLLATVPPNLPKSSS